MKLTSISGAAKARSDHSASASEPISQPKMAPSARPEMNISSATPAASTADTA